MNEKTVMKNLHEKTSRLNQIENPKNETKTAKKQQEHSEKTREKKVNQ